MSKRAAPHELRLCAVFLNLPSRLPCALPAFVTWRPALATPESITAARCPALAYTSGQTAGTSIALSAPLRFAYLACVCFPRSIYKGEWKARRAAKLCGLDC